MKKLFLLMTAMMLAMVVSAGNVTPEEALQRATEFMKERVAKGARRAPAAASSLIMAKNVSGLYVINVGQNDGFVIVSPDDRTVPVLGYADSGTLDPDNMPDNMRSWLQGYADEIKWLNEHNYQPSAARRAPSAVKEPIAPLVTSHWNQDEPYNNQVKTYAPDGKSGVTGCVATAMAQVMYYTAKHAGLETSKPTVEIPSYTASASGKVIPGVSADEVIRWDLMRDTYKKTDADDGADAVAALMRICGAALEMNYRNNVSSAHGEDIQIVLKYYFGYAETVMVVARSYYSYANWIEMLYNELKQGRAMPYGGQSVSSGHEFICDGYQGEDYFHINWGWGGLSDGYFQLSVLDADEQGIGGSTSGDNRYNTGQHAIVGIQLEGGTGTVLSEPNEVDLTLNSVTADKTEMTIGETAHVTFNVTNNSSDDYDGELGFSFFDKGLGDGKMFLIPAGETKDCVMDFRPTSAGTYKITAYQATAVGTFHRMSNDIYVEITVTEGVGNPTSDEIEITSSLAFENSEPNKFYGTTFKATLTLTNPETDTDYSGYVEYVLSEKVDDESEWKTKSYKVSGFKIPANGSVNIPLEYSGLTINAKYRLGVVQYHFSTNNWGEWKYPGDDYYVCTPAIIAYSADGTATVTKASETSYAAPAGVVFVEISGLGITNVNHVEPNCTFLMGTTDAVPTGATNYVQYDGANYTTTNITLTDGHDFYKPVDFTASNIEFTYNCDRWADGTNGWNTIMLPFDVTSVTANGIPIDWFNSNSDTGKQFWLKEFTGDDTSAPKVYFDYVSGDMKANTPYIIALPGNHWGTENDLSNKTIKFIGSGVVKKSAPIAVTASNYRFVGDTKAVNTENIYCINAAGNKFELKATGGSAAFRPFFKSDIFDLTYTSLAIGGDSETTGIDAVRSKTDDVSSEVFDLQGRRIVKPVKGLFIVRSAEGRLQGKNGKIVIINK